MCECPRPSEDPQYEENLPHLHCTPGRRSRNLGFRAAAHLSVGVRGADDDEPGQVLQDERTARMVLSMIFEPDDAVTGRLLGEVGRWRCSGSLSVTMGCRASAPLTHGLAAVRAFRRSDTLPAHRRSPAHGYRRADPWRPRLAVCARRSWRSAAICPVDSWRYLVPGATAQRVCHHHRREGRDLLRRACGRTTVFRPRQR